MHLPIEERAKLANKLLLSIEFLSESEIDEAWLKEVMDRAQALVNISVYRTSNIKKYWRE